MQINIIINFYNKIRKKHEYLIKFLSRETPLTLELNFYHCTQGFFSKFLMGDSKFSVPIGPRRGRSRMGGGTCEKNPTEAKTAHLMQN